MSDKLVRANQLVQKFRLLQSTLNRLEGEASLIHRNMKRDFDVDTIKEAEHLHLELTRRHVKIDKRIEELTNELEEELG